MAAKLAGSGGSKYSLGQNSEINVTPFVDILLVLLIIFMVAVPMATVSIRLDLPPATPPPPDQKPVEPTFVSIQKDGGIYIADTQTSLDRLSVDLEARMRKNNPELAGPAKELFASLAGRWMCDYDDTQAIGRRYRRQDEIGTPYCVTFDFDSLEDRSVTVRDRDSMQQDRVHVDSLVAYLEDRLS